MPRASRWVTQWRLRRRSSAHGIYIMRPGGRTLLRRRKAPYGVPVTVFHSRNVSTCPTANRCDSLPRPRFYRGLFLYFDKRIFFTLFLPLRRTQNSIKSWKKKGAKAFATFFSDPSSRALMDAPDISFLCAAKNAAYGNNHFLIGLEGVGRRTIPLRPR